ncbi:M15 family metallopeptidase [Streptomyces sp. McG3]|uniref:M15 family metallopeptidase n=1 Tax=Streptomyces sp. McG3 TaxID=2725483 RepID=UPI001BE8145F|nr:M15 family metallopeptidase [Streptomyces sp. McG3]MBT2899599.1 M15 family metallopeptidase [Streptomyces sp. McG3]
MAAIAAALGHFLLNPAHAPSTTASPRSPSTAPSSARAPLPPPLHRELRGGPGTADGAVPDGATVLDDGIPAVANLDADLLAALRRAAREAAREGVGFAVNSGWRSPEYQDQLLRKAIARYGSEAEAARWVATAKTSPHVSGDAVDIGPADATEWLSEHGAAYGLCQTYRNEPWHYELRTEAIGGGCPRMYADPTQDPRMRP